MNTYNDDVNVAFNWASGKDVDKYESVVIGATGATGPVGATGATGQYIPLYQQFTATASQSVTAINQATMLKFSDSFGSSTPPFTISATDNSIIRNSISGIYQLNYTVQFSSTGATGTVYLWLIPNLNAYPKSTNIITMQANEISSISKCITLSMDGDYFRLAFAVSNTNISAAGISNQPAFQAPETPSVSLVAVKIGDIENF